MRHIDTIIVHCSATAEGKDWDIKGIDRYHKSLGWKGIGYHFVIYRDGTVHHGRPIEEVGAHAKGHNATSIGICYIGGMSANGTHAKDTRTPAQRQAMKQLIQQLIDTYHIVRIIGHNEVSNKACPSFDVQKWRKEVGL